MNNNYMVLTKIIYEQNISKNIKHVTYLLNDVKSEVGKLWPACHIKNFINFAFK